ncbi:MAG: hypothetical protein ACLTK0_07820 [Anaerovoracaceae bacterium]
MKFIFGIYMLSTIMGSWLAGIHGLEQDIILAQRLISSSLFCSTMPSM